MAICNKLFYREAYTSTITTDGKKIVQFVKFRKDITEEFYIASDSESISYDVVF